jgi:hypothetical protein
VAAVERGVNRTVYKLLKGYLLRSVWLYAAVGLLQFSLTGLYWLRGWGRAPIAAMELGLWGAAAALNANSLVWRSLPIAAKDASVFRWWAMVGAPGIYLTLLTGITWASHRSSGFPIPALDVIWEGTFANLAVLGMVAVLLRSPRFYVVRAPAAKATFTVTFAIFLQCYGLPVGSAARPYSIVFIAVGVIFLILSAVQAFRRKQWRWPDIATASSARTKGSRAAPAVLRYGVWTVLLPLLRRTAIAAAIATALVVVLNFIFPRAGAALFWVYFIGISTAGFLLTFQFRSALQPLRCLPLSTKQLAGLLLVFGSLPGVATLGLTFLVNRAFLNANMDFSAVATFALIIIASQALPLPQLQQARAQARYLGRWFPLLQRILLPVYMGVMAATYSVTFAALWWFRWGLVAAGVALCVSGYFILVYQLRAGIRPSSNDRLFSAG